MSSTGKVLHSIRRSELYRTCVLLLGGGPLLFTGRNTERAYCFDNLVAGTNLLVEHQRFTPVRSPELLRRTPPVKHAQSKLNPTHWRNKIREKMTQLDDFMITVGGQIGEIDKICSASMPT